VNGHFTEEVKKEIEADIEADFELGYQGIKMLPKDARFGVFVAYIYYSKLLNKISQIPASVIMQERIRISDRHKYALFCSSLFRHSFNLL
jgi:phytoene/squalene synthetase